MSDLNLEGRTKFSASLLKNWMNCPLQVKLDQQLEGPSPQNAAAVFGSCVHEALELYNTVFDVVEATNRFIFTWENPDSLGLRIDYYPSKTTWKEYKDMGISMINAYHDDTKSQARTVLGTEVVFCVPFGEDFLLSGIVDLLEMEFSDIPVLYVKDFKTATRQPTKLKLLFDIQMTIYYYASMQPEFWLGMPEVDPKYAGVPDGEEWMEVFNHELAERKVIWWHLRKMKEIECDDREEGDFVRLHRLLSNVKLAMDNGIYIPSINEESCFWCPHKTSCTSTGPVAHKFDQARWSSTPVKFKSLNSKEEGYQGDKWLL